MARCPPLQSYYPERQPATTQEWAAKLPALEAMLESCLRSPEYFALLGAAQLNTGQIQQALESLERALLLDPDNGAAQIDFAESLYLTGQLLPALELNVALMKREDLPANLLPMLEARQRLWTQQTKRAQFLLEVTEGYDNNLNGAPARSDLTLTLGGTPISLTLSEANRPEEGSFTSLRAGGDWQWVTPTGQHDLLGAVRVRKAAPGDNDLAQADWRYTYTLPARHHQWEVTGGTSHLLFGGSPLYSIADLRGRYILGDYRCRPSLEGGLQELHYHGQEIMDGMETSLSAGLGCGFTDWHLQWRLEAGVLENRARQAGRPGGDRGGWNARLGWQWQLGGHELSVDLGKAQLEDDTGYSPLLANNQARKISNEYINLRYRWSFSAQLALVIRLGHQEQRSNLEPFQSRGAAGEVGLVANF